ncbi:ATP-binding protein [Achromobacter xylosoxidans]
MLRNLVDNALRYAPQGNVDIQATPVAGYRVALTVSDRGPGIADDEKEAVQQRFTRGRTGESQPGSGLGLAIVRSVAVAHGGSLWLQDRSGGGLSARVILPLARPRTGRGLAGWIGVVGAAFLLLSAAPADVRAAEVPEIVTRYPAPQPSSRVLTIAGPTDTPVVAPLILGFQAQRPDVTVVYREMGSRELYEAAIEDRLKDVDVLMSSASDLQIRLANDGYAQRYTSPYAARLPSWAVWRNEVYGFTFEPAVIVYNPKRYSEATVPRSRQDLLRTLEQDRARLHGRVGTYDISRSSVGYLMAEQDELVSSNFWGLANAFGQVGVRLSATTAELLDAIENDEMDLGYNILGRVRPVAPGGGRENRRGVPAGLRAGAGALGADRAARAQPRPGARAGRLAAVACRPAGGVQPCGARLDHGGHARPLDLRGGAGALAGHRAAGGAVAGVAGGAGPAAPFALRAELDPAGHRHARTAVGRGGPGLARGKAGERPPPKDRPLARTPGLPYPGCRPMTGRRQTPNPKMGANRSMRLSIPIPNGDKTCLPSPDWRPPAPQHSPSPQRATPSKCPRATRPTTRRSSRAPRRKARS